MSMLVDFGDGGGLGKSKPKRPGKKPARRPARDDVPADPPEFDAIPGVPTTAEIDAVASKLTAADRKVFAAVRTELARHLGSHAAARVWLTSPGTGFVAVPLDLIRDGGVARVWAVLQDQWGPNPPYA